MQNLVNETPPKKNYDFVDSIRGLSMISIVADHNFFLGIYLYPDYSVRYWTYFSSIQIAKFGTVAFFLLAGFLLGDKFVSYTSAQYIGRRFKSTFKPWLIWSLIFLSAILIRDAINYAHYGSGGFDFLQFLKDDLTIVYLRSSYWFIINFLICITILLTFKRYLYSWKLGAGLLVCTLFYSVNVYFEWIIPEHTTALFGFVFFLWLGAQMNKHKDRVFAAFKKISYPLLIALVLITFLLSIGETSILYQRKSEDPFNTLRFSNILYSLAFFALLFKIHRFRFADYIKPRETTFGIYLIHFIFVFSLLPEIFRGVVPANLSAPMLVGYQLIRLVLVYCLTLVLVKLINRSRIKWIIGSR